MPCKILYCTKHFQGPLDAWYDCHECCQGAKEEALKHVRWLHEKQIQKLLKSTPNPSPPRDADRSEQETFVSHLAHVAGS